MKKGDSVLITHAGCTLPGKVELVTKFDTAGAVSFKGILGGYVGVMPIMTEENGALTDMVKGQPVEVKPIT